MYRILSIIVSPVYLNKISGSLADLKCCPAGSASVILTKMRKVVSNTDTHTSTNGFHSIDYIKITILGFGLTALWGSLHSIVLPLRLLDFVPESLKNTYLGYLTFTGLILAMAVQPIAGAISDRSGFAWGRRRPYILVGMLYYFCPE